MNELDAGTGPKSELEELAPPERVRLERQEALLAQTLASPALSRPQRRVQGALLAETRRQRLALEAGWEPFQPSAQWTSGYLDDPRFLRGHVSLAAGAIALPFTVMEALALATQLKLDALGALASGLVLLTGFYLAVREVLGRWAEHHDRAFSENSAGQIRIFNSALPPAAVAAYQRARQSGLFEQFTVHSPRPQDFRAVEAYQAPSLGLLDPVLAGWIAGHSFLIAQWDLARDLSS